MSFENGFNQSNTKKITGFSKLTLNYFGKLMIDDYKNVDCMLTTELMRLN